MHQVELESRGNKAKRYSKNYFERGCQHSASPLLPSVPSHLFLWLFASEEISVSETPLFFFMAEWCSPFRGCWDALFIRRAAEFMCCFQMLRNRQGSMMNRQRQPRCQSKVNSLSIAGGEMTPRARTSPAQTASQTQLLLTFVCVHSGHRCFVPACSSCLCQF